jgi:uncharacterized protein involved in outer membrane biogenesis
MKILLKWLAYLVAGLVSLLVVAVIVLKLIPDEKYRDWIATAATSATGRDVSIEALQLDIGTFLRVRADKVRVANADWSKQADMFSMDRLEADFGLLPLLAGKADIRLVVGATDVLVEKNAEGVSNWALGPEKPELEAEEADDADRGEFSGLPLQPVIREIRIDDFRVTQLTGPDAEPIVRHLKQFHVVAPEQDTIVSLVADMNGRPVTLDGNLGDMNVFLDQASQPMQLSGDINGNSLKVSGNWGPLYPERVMDIDVALNIPATAELAALVGLSIEEFEDINITAKIIGDGERFALDPLVVNLDDPTAKLSITGSVQDLASMSGIHIETDANTASLKTLLTQLGIEVPTELPPEIELSAKVDGGLDALAMRELVVVARDEGMEIKATSTIGDLLNVRKVNVNVTGNIDSLSSLSKYAQTELPATDPLIIKASIAEDKDTPFALKAHAEAGGINVDVSSDFQSLTVPDKLDLAVSVTASSMADFNRLAQREFHDHGPVELKANIVLAQGDIAVNDISMTLRDPAVKGNISVDMPADENQVPEVNGRIDISYLNLDHLLPKPAEVTAEGEAPTTETAEAEQAAQPVESEKVEKPESDRLFSSEPFLTEKMHALNVDVAIHADKIDYGETSLTDVQLALNLKDGLLVVEPIKAAGGAGNIDGVVRIDGRGDAADMDVDLTITKIPMPNLGGAIDFDMDLDGRGKSVAELMGSLNGQVLLVARDGKIKQSLVSEFGTGLFSFSEDKDYTNLECAILRVDIKDGIADFDDKLAAQLTEVTWRGGGKVNLKTEKLDAGISPKPRKGIPITAGGLASLVHVGGTLKNPKVQLDPKDVAVRYAKYTAHVATGGLTWIAQKLKDKFDANKDMCELILEGTVFEDVDKKKEKEKKKAAEEAEEESSE